MNPQLIEVAKRVNWYTDPEELLKNNNLFLCQVMSRGHTDDVILIQNLYSKDAFKEAYLHAPGGLFDARSWAYWGLILMNNPSLPMPQRFSTINDFDWRKFCD